MVKIRLAGNIIDRFETSNTKFAVMEVKRKTGIIDTVFILDNEQLFQPGTKTEINGEVLARKFSKETRKMWYIRPLAVTKIDFGWHNQVEGEVIVSDVPKFRQTPAGKRILDLSLNDADNKCYLYAIVFNDLAEELYATIKKGDRIKITKARLQSRLYGPELNQLMIHEILINEIQKL